MLCRWSLVFEWDQTTRGWNFTNSAHSWKEKFNRGCWKKEYIRKELTGPQISIFVSSTAWICLKILHAGIHPSKKASALPANFLQLIDHAVLRLNIPLWLWYFMRCFYCTDFPFFPTKCCMMDSRVCMFHFLHVFQKHVSQADNQTFISRKLLFSLDIVNSFLQ